MNHFTGLMLLGIGCYLGVGLVACSSTQPSEKAATSSSPAVASSTSTLAPSPQVTPSTNSTSASPNPAKPPSPQPSPAIAAALRPPLTVEKLKNAEYFFLAKGPIKLSNGTYEDKDTKRVYAMSDVVAYGDIDKDGIKDAVTSLKVTIPNTGDFSYLVAVVNEAGNPKNISTEFMGPGIKVKTLKINSDNSIEAVMDQYQAGDPACCPSLKLTRIYKLKSNQTQSPQPNEPKK
jgi:hypothetical protein